MAATSHLVTFPQPPVNEVAMAVQFATQCVDVEILGAVTSRLKREYPGRQQQPPLPRMHETSGLLNPAHVEFQTLFPGFPRTWFIDQDSHFLVQVQADRIAANWRRLDPGTTYPRYEALRERAQAAISALLESAESAGSELAPVDFLELSYFNEIVHPESTPGGPHTDLGGILRPLDWSAAGTFLPNPDDAQVQARWTIPVDALPASSEIGRLYLTVVPGLQAVSQLPIWVINLVARIVPPVGTQIAEALEIIDIGHEWIVRGFADLTTPEAHALWGGLQ